MNKPLRKRRLLQLMVLVGLLQAVVVQAAPLAELVSVRTADRVLLHGLLYSPAGGSAGIVIHIPGGPGAFYGMQNMAPMAESLNDAGYHFLSMNTRTAGANGLMYARFEDYRLDVEAAVSLAERQGFEQIVLLGHSLGSARVVYYLAESPDEAVDAVVLSGVIASPYLEAQERWDKEQRAAYDAFLAEQRARVEAGRGREVAAYPWFGPKRPELMLSAASWVSLFGAPQESDASTTKFAAEIDLPVLIVHGTNDETALPVNAEALLEALTDSPDKELVWIEGGDHLFMEQAEEYARIVTDWVKQQVEN